MPIYEVKVQVVTTKYYMVTAKSEEDAENSYPGGIENGEFVDMEEVIDVYPYDTRFEEDDQLGDRFIDEEEDTDE